MISLEDFLRPSQKKLFKRLCKMFKGNTLVSKGNFILVRGETPILLVAHLDTVHEKRVRDICLSADKNILMSPQGIGGDDRCGVFALVYVYLAAQVKPWLLFTCDEEVGGLGANKFALAHKQNLLPKELDLIKCIVEVDRRGANDAVFYQCANLDFENYITGKGFKTAKGSFSDISIIAPELGIAAVNLSAGYHNAHTLHEFINRSELDNTVQKLLEIVDDSSHLNFVQFRYIKSANTFYSPKKIILQDDLPYSKKFFNDEQVPCSLPPELQEIYDVLLDFYSPNELETFRAEFGDNILWQIYRDEIEPIYYR